MEAGERGLEVQAVAKHVYNMNVTLFFTPDYEEIRSYVRQYLLKNSKSAQSLVERTAQRGRYRLNTRGSQHARQLMLQFSDLHDDTTPADEEKLRHQDLSLDLFQ